MTNVVALRKCPHCGERTGRTCARPACLEYFETLRAQVSDCMLQNRIRFDEALDAVIEREKRAGRVR